MRIDLDLLDRLPDETEFTVRITAKELRGLYRSAGAEARRDVSLHEFAERIGRARSTARGLCNSGKVPGAYKQSGRDWWIPEWGVKEYLEVQEQSFSQPRSKPRKEVRLDGWRDDLPASARQRPRRRARG